MNKFPVNFVPMTGFTDTTIEHSEYISSLCTKTVKTLFNTL